MQTRLIEIDLELHKAIESRRQSFDETLPDILRRELSLPRTKAVEARSAGRAWEGKGVSLPHGTAVRMRENGVLYEGVIADGFWVVNGARHKSPSGAAKAVVKTKAGTQTNLNGWDEWEAREPGSESWFRISERRTDRAKADGASLLRELGL